MTSSSHSPPLSRVREFVASAAPAVVMLVVLLAGWEALSRSGRLPAWMLPAPHEVLQQLARDWKRWGVDTGTTLIESVLGFLLGALFGIGFGIVFAHSRLLERILYPYI